MKLIDNASKVLRQAWSVRPVIDTLARPWQKDHCRMAYESEILRLQYTAEFRAVRDIALTIKDH